MQNTFPQNLSIGATIAICSTARKISVHELQPTITFLKENGFKVHLSKTIGTALHQFSGSETQRLDDLQELLDDTNIRAILFARGGYGTVQILDGISWDNFRATPKWLIGYSDLTALLIDSFSATSIGSIHGPMPINFNDNTLDAWKSLMSVLLHGPKNDLLWNGSDNDIQGVATGVLVGGNLSVIYSLLGSNSLPDMTNKILFIEDLDEYLYHIDRMLWNVKRNGIFDKIAGVIVGSFSSMHDNTTPFGKTAIEIIQDILSCYKFPVAFNAPFGHCEDNQPLIVGANVQLTVSGKENSLIYL